MEIKKEKDIKKKCKLLIIGNGFDLLLGLPTRFSNFIDFCKLYNHFIDYIDEPKDGIVTYDFNRKLDEYGTLNITEDLLHTFPCTYKDNEKIILRDVKREICESKLINHCFKLNKDKNYNAR